MAARKTTDDFIIDAKKVHGDKYDYSKVVYENSKTKVEIVCSKHGSFWQEPGSHLNGRGCTGCYGSKKKNTKQFIKEAQNIHGEKYDYSKVKYKNNICKIKITCSKHGEFLQAPVKHLSGRGCPNCKLDKFRLTSETFIKKSRKIHDNKYDYSEVEYNGYYNNVVIICSKHG